MPGLAQLSNDLSPRGRQALAKLLEQSAFYRFLETHSAFVENPTEFESMPVTGAQPVQHRALDGGYNPESMGAANRVPDTLKFSGFELKIDRSRREDARRGLRSYDSWLERKLTIKHREFSRGMEVVGLAGDSGVDALQPDGFLTILDGSAVPGLGAATLTISAREFLSGAANHFDLSDPANYRLFVEKLQEAVSDLCPMANGLVMNTTARGRMTTILKETHSLDEARNLFGVVVPAFDGKEIVAVRKQAITNTEPDAAAAQVTTSFLAMEAGEGACQVNTNSGFEYSDWDAPDADEDDDKPRFTERCEVRQKPTVEHDEAALRITDIKL